MSLAIIFIEFPKYLSGIARILSKLGFRIYYLKIKTMSDGDNDHFAEYLKSKNIMPLPIEELKELIEDDEGDHRYAKRLLNYVSTIVPEKLLHKENLLYYNVRNLSKKIITVLYMHYFKYIYTATIPVNYFARTQFPNKVILCGLSLSDIYIPFLGKNVILFVIPINDIFVSIKVSIQYFGKGLKRIYSFIQKKDHTELNSQLGNNLPSQPKVAYAIHGETYGSLFEKNLYYSPEITSDFNKKNILHIDYSNFSYDPSLPVVFFGNHYQYYKLHLLSSIKYITQTISLIKNIHQMKAYFVLMKSYILFNSYRCQLQKFPSLKLLLVDYDFLCPKEIILACESLKIKTLATTERYLATINNSAGGSILVDDYLSPSSVSINFMKGSEGYSVKNYIAVGQYRSDYLCLYKSEIPSVLKKPIRDGKKIIVALGYITDLTWHESMSDYLANWSNHIQFLSDMIQLSKDLSNVFVILRYKRIDWINLPVFSEKVAEINDLDNICISDCYNEYNYSYKLCAHADLVIAKPTSIADECLSCGIPVLYHDYLCNCKNFAKYVFDYGNEDIFCEEYNDLLSKSKKVLTGTEDIKEKYAYIRSYAFDNLGDGKTIDRVREYVYSTLNELS